MLDFAQIMAPLGPAVFLKDYWLKQFVHIPGSAGRFTALLTWDGLNGILQQHRLTPPRLKLYKDGQPLDPSQYLTPAMFGVPRVDAGRLVLSLAQGASLIIDDVQEMAPHVRDLMGVFQDALQTDYGLTDLSISLTRTDFRRATRSLTEEVEHTIALACTETVGDLKLPQFELSAVQTR